MKTKRRLKFLRLAVVGLAASALVGAGTVNAEAFTLFYARPHVTVSPTAGLAAAPFTVHGNYVWNGPCPKILLIFKFYWYKVISNKVLVWTTTSNVCNGSVVDPGSSPQLHPPPLLSYPSTFVIQVAVYLSNGQPAGPTYTDTTVYQVRAPAPTPSPRPSPSPRHSPAPSPTPCAHPTAALPPIAPSGRDAAVIIVLAVAMTLPVGGIGMVFFSGFFSRRIRVSGLAALIGMCLVLLTAGCSMTNAPTAQATPTQAQPSPSPSPPPTPSPTPTC